MRLRREKLGHLMPGSPPGRERKLSEAEEEQLILLVLDKPDATLEELAELVSRRLSLDFARPRGLSAAA